MITQSKPPVPELHIGKEQLGSTHGPFRIMRNVILLSGSQENLFRYGIVHGFQMPRLVAGIPNDQSLMDLSMVVSLAAQALLGTQGGNDFSHDMGAWKMQRDSDGTHGIYLWINKKAGNSADAWFRRWHFRPENTIVDLDKALGFMATLRNNTTTVD